MLTVKGFELWQAGHQVGRKEVPVSLEGKVYSIALHTSKQVCRGKEEGGDREGAEKKGAGVRRRWSNASWAHTVCECVRVHVSLYLSISLLLSHSLCLQWISPNNKQQTTNSDTDDTVAVTRPRASVSSPSPEQGCPSCTGLWGSGTAAGGSRLPPARPDPQNSLLDPVCSKIRSFCYCIIYVHIIIITSQEPRLTQ